MIQQADFPPPSHAAFHIDRFRPEDAEGIVRLVHSVYGSHYPIPLFYDANALIDANRKGRYLSFVARADSGEIVGVNHLFPSTPNPSLLECGVGMVHREYRGAGINTRILQYIYEVFVPEHPHIETVFGEAVCNHVIQHRMMERFAFIETAIEVALMPAAAYSKEESASGRVATLDGFRSYRRKPHRIFLPEPYADMLRTITARLDDVRETTPSSQSIPLTESSVIDLKMFDFAQVARIAVRAIGSDFAKAFDTIEREAIERSAVVLQTWLNLGTPWVGKVVEMLRDRGYIFGGLLPRWFDTDGLLMQKLLCNPNFEEIQLLSAFSKELLAYIRQDGRS